MGDYTTSISFVCRMPLVFQTNVHWAHKWKNSALNNNVCTSSCMITSKVKINVLKKTFLHSVGGSI